MNVTELDLPGVLLLEPEVFGDERGFFLETWQARRYAKAGIPERFVQDNLSRSLKNVLRGLHYQVRRPQGKLVWVIDGEVFDVVADVDPQSGTYGRWVGVRLSGDNKHQLYVPPGYAHGFCVLSDAAYFAYKCTDYYAAELERGVRWDDPRLAIDWPVDEPILNDRDAAWPTLQDAPREELPKRRFTTQRSSGLMCSCSSELGPPVFVMGAPRSGTTYVAELLNRHSQVFITNELRVMTFLNRALNRAASNKWVLMNGRKEFLKSLELDLPGMVERHYRRLGAPPGVRWGDKNPHYADSETDPECLNLIDRLYPEAQFINMVRNGRDVVASLMRKKWVEFDDAIDVWRRHVEHAAEFSERVGEGRILHLRFEDLVADDAATARQLCNFLGLEVESEMLDFAAGQSVDRTPFSKPTSDLAMVGRRSSSPRFEREMEEALVAKVGDLLARYGYM